MSDIKVGDLVVVVRGHVCDLGEIYRVVEIVPGSSLCGTWQCPKCLVWGNADEMVALKVRAGPSSGDGANLSWLRRIPPLSELETTEHKERLTA